MDKKEKENLQDLLEKYYEDEANDSDSAEVTKSMLDQLEDDADEECGPDTSGINIYDLGLPENSTLYGNLYDAGLEDAVIKIDSEGNVLTYGLLPGDTISFVGAFTDSFPGKDQQEITEYLKNAYDIKVNHTDTDSSEEENNSDSELEIEDAKSFIEYMTKLVASAFNLTDKKDTTDIKNEMTSILSDLENLGVVEKDTSENSQDKESDDVKSKDDESDKEDSGLDIEDATEFINFLANTVISIYTASDGESFAKNIKDKAKSILENSQVKEPDNIKDYPFARQKPMLVWHPENSVELKAVLATNVILNEITGEITFYNKDTPENSLKIIPEDSTDDYIHKVIYLKLEQPIFYEGNGCYNIKLYYDENGYIDSFSFIH